MFRSYRGVILLACSIFVGVASVGGQDTKPAPSTMPAEIDRLIRQLGDDDFDVREAASRALEAIGEPAWDALQKAVRGTDAEVQRSVEVRAGVQRQRELREVVVRSGGHVAVASELRRRILRMH